MDDTDDNHDALGGRLPLLAPDELSGARRTLHERLTATRVARGSASGYRGALPDGRLIGPFNAFLRAPEIGTAQLAWAEAISSAGLPAAVREVVICTVGAEWGAVYPLYAHAIAARSAGVADEHVTAIVARADVTGLPDDQDVAHRLTLALVRDHDVPDTLYAAALDRFGETGLVELVSLAGQYLATCALVACFRVPAPPH